MLNMKRGPRQPRQAGIYRDVIARNVGALMRLYYDGSSNMPKKLAEDSGVGLYTVQRMVAGKSGCTIDSIEKVALQLGVSVYQLFIPNLNIRNPQVVQGATKEEERLYKQFDDAAKAEKVAR